MRTILNHSLRSFNVSLNLRKGNEVTSVQYRTIIIISSTEIKRHVVDSQPELTVQHTTYMEAVILPCQMSTGALVLVFYHTSDRKSIVDHSPACCLRYGHLGVIFI